ncbi:MAG: hypothetical protein Q4F43_10490, partial [Eubacteriales bacterium]|nr:hypothetical protein [Eubacteriales bacterium]
MLRKAKPFSAKVVGITFYDKDSNIINPTFPVRVTFQDSAFMEADINLIFTVTDDDYIVPVNQYDPVANNLAMDEVAFDADKSNFFAVVGTNTVEDAETGDEEEGGEGTEAEVRNTVLTAEAADVIVRVTAPAEAGIPEVASISLTEIKEDDASYGEYLAKTKEVFGWERLSACGASQSRSSPTR